MFGGAVGLDTGTGSDTVVGRALRLQAGVSVTASLEEHLQISMMFSKCQWCFLISWYFPNFNNIFHISMVFSKFQWYFQTSMIFSLLRRNKNGHANDERKLDALFYQGATSGKPIRRFFDSPNHASGLVSGKTVGI